MCDRPSRFAVSRRLTPPAWSTIGEREQLLVDQQVGVSLRTTAKRLRRSHTTLARELARNRGPDGRYQPHRAQREALRRQQVAGIHRAGKPRWLRRFVHDKLTEDWSPEQIAGHLSEYELPNLTPETIYRWIYEPAWRSDTLWAYLRRGQPRRRQYPGRRVQRPWVTKRRFIDERPDVAATRVECGHWETDLMAGKQRDVQVLSVTVDRRLGYVLLDLVAGHGGAAKLDSHRRTLTGLPPWLRHTVTSDSGPENSLHRQTAAALGVEHYFCHPGQAQEKGSCENTIGLIRQYLPKGFSLDHLTSVDVRWIAERLNRRPRKRFGGRTPHELFSQTLGGAIRM